MYAGQVVEKRRRQTSWITMLQIVLRWVGRVHEHHASHGLSMTVRKGADDIGAVGVPNEHIGPTLSGNGQQVKQIISLAPCGWWPRRWLAPPIARPVIGADAGALCDLRQYPRPLQGKGKIARFEHDHW